MLGPSLILLNYLLTFGRIVQQSVQSDHRQLCSSLPPLLQSPRLAPSLAILRITASLLGSLLLVAGSARDKDEDVSNNQMLVVR